MSVSRLFQLLTVAGCISAFVIRDEPQFNSTTDSPQATSLEVSPALLTTTVSDAKTSWRPKVHGESTADSFEDMGSARTDGRVRFEATATNFDVAMPTTGSGRGSKDSVTIIDIGTVIQAIITSWSAIPTVHFEHSAEDWGQTDHDNPSTPQSSRHKLVEVSDNPWTTDLQTPQTTVLERPTADQPRFTTISERTMTDFPPPPAITYDGLTVRPVAVTRKPTVVLPGGVVTTTEEVEFQVAVGSSTVSIGAPITINDVVIGITVNAAGLTILSAGDITTMLPKPTAGEVRTVGVTTQGLIDVMTAVISGTTKYIFAGQTLAPGQPVTIGNTPISISTSEDQTVLFVGNTTTTLATIGSITQAITDFPGVSVGTQGTVTNGGPSNVKSTSTKSGVPGSNSINTAFACFAVGITTLMLIT